MIQDDFGRAFATSDPHTVQHVRDEDIPRLQSDIEEMQAIVARCMASGQMTDAAMALQETIGRMKQTVGAAQSRLRRALQGSARHQHAPAIAVVVEGGLVQAVVTNRPDYLDANLPVQIIDYDTDGADEDELLLVPNGDGSFSEACGHTEPVAEARIDIDGIRPKTSDSRLLQR